MHTGLNMNVNDKELTNNKRGVRLNFPAITNLANLRWFVDHAWQSHLDLHEQTEWGDIVELDPEKITVSFHYDAVKNEYAIQIFYRPKDMLDANNL